MLSRAISRCDLPAPLAFVTTVQMSCFQHKTTLYTVTNDYLAIHCKINSRYRDKKITKTKEHSSSLHNSAIFCSWFLFVLFYYRLPTPVQRSSCHQIYFICLLARKHLTNNVFLHDNNVQTHNHTNNNLSNHDLNQI